MSSWLVYLAVGLVFGIVSGILAAKKLMRYFYLGLLVLLIVALVLIVGTGQSVDTVSLDISQFMASFIGQITGHYTAKWSFERGL